MGILSWWKGGGNNNKQSQQSESDNSKPSPKAVEFRGLNGAVEVPRPSPNITVFEFGTIAASADKVTLAGYCPVPEDLEPCRWEILLASAADAPQYRIAF